MSEDFFSPAGQETPSAGRDPREYPVPDEWAFGKPSGSPRGPRVRNRQPHIGAIILILAGVLFFLNNTGLLHIHSIFAYWPLILIAVGASKLGCSRGFGQVWALTVMGLGVLFLLQNLGIVSVSFVVVWPVGLIAVGLLMLLSRGGMMPTVPWRNAVSMPPASHDEREVHLFAVFGGVKRVMDSSDFRGGEALAIFGGVELDMRLARLSGDVKEVHLLTNALFGGIEIKVPDNWRVAVRGAGIFGGYDDKTLRRQSTLSPDSPLLVITGYAVFGGVEVKS